MSFVRSTDPDYYYTLVVNPEEENARKVNFEQEGYRIKTNDKGEEEKIYGKPMEEAHRIAVEVSAYVCTQSGTMPSYPETLVAKVK